MQAATAKATKTDAGRIPPNTSTTANSGNPLKSSASTKNSRDNSDPSTTCRLLSGVVSRMSKVLPDCSDAMAPAINSGASRHTAMTCPYAISRSTCDPDCANSAKLTVSASPRPDSSPSSTSPTSNPRYPIRTNRCRLRRDAPPMIRTTNGLPGTSRHNHRPIACMLRIIRAAVKPTPEECHAKAAKVRKGDPRG